MSGILAALVGARSAGVTLAPFPGGTTSATSPMFSATATVGFSGSGQIRLDNFTATGGAMYYSNNGGVFTAIVGGETLTLVNGGTLQFRYNAASPNNAGLDIYDITAGVYLGSVSFTKT